RQDVVKGKLNDFVPSAGEMMPETIENILRKFKSFEPKAFATPEAPPSRRPSLCAGCPHRASFFAIKKVFPSAKSIYTSDIGCYTLGINLKAVDTFICMGGSISQASGFYHAYNVSGESSPFIVSTIGDSTFFHAGIPPLIDAVTTGAKFLLVILDNSTTAMTGNQPTAESFKDKKGNSIVSIEKIVKACGVKYCKIVNPFEFNTFISVLKNAYKKAKSGVAVVIAKSPCLMDRSKKIERKQIRVIIDDKCDGCGYCLREFECPAIIQKDKKTSIDYYLCSNCGICIHVCPKKAIVSESTI
ncbi:MAG: thiamine pyrophosphate-dependent enzyme, partial [Thermodesulfovibrionales bacterium]|nr:thiamine pyrophosphate-dependent enzyme [Thermodesulfovibrionales bacterium]